MPGVHDNYEPRLANACKCINQNMLAYMQQIKVHVLQWYQQQLHSLQDGSQYTHTLMLLCVIYAVELELCTIT